ncbi:DUF1700 domain-containing protein [Eupransor demetentiae]|uniref:Uncharacterized membrane protein n=1 Tax=Eupransor demetentiae TaxID=3109584 RepID=A0ABM9N4Y6_9LACO|nr:Uncharacterized membrane protein [Lactobacillaceae bacterium LMG 33000]
MTYLDELSHHLGDLAASDRQDILDYYQNYFADGHLTDEQARQKLGSPQQLAEKLKADLTGKDSSQGHQKSGKTKREKVPHSLSEQIVFWTLLVLLSPIWLPILMTVAILLLVLPFTFACIIFAFVLTGILMVVCLPFIIFQSFWGSLYCLGIAFMMFGLVILIWPSVRRLGVMTWNWLRLGWQRILDLMKREVNHE